MAGHSHWAGIKYKKGRADRQRSKIFSKISREVTVSAKHGGKNPEMNARLRSAIQAAKTANMPKENIDRAISKSEINQGSNYDSLRYEGFGAENVAVIIETLTDNKNRTASNLRTIFQKFNFGLGETGSASHQFRQVGIIRIDKNKVTDEKILEIAINDGADDCISTDFFHEITTKKENFYKVKTKIEKRISDFISAEIGWKPLNKIVLNKEKSKVAIDFLERLEDDDDVQNVYTNF